MAGSGREAGRARGRLRHRATPVLLLSLCVAACGDTRERELRAMPEFCRDALPRVDAFLAEFDPPGGEQYGGTAVVGALGEIPDGMNALVAADQTANQHQTFVNLMTLIRFDKDLEPEPYLATSWELNDDGTELVFHLRDDVRWHDGAPTTAYDVEFTYLRAVDPETGFPNAAFWAQYERGPGGVAVVDSFTVRFGLEPHAEFMDPWRAMAIMPRHLLEDVPPAELRQHPFGTRCPVGNGPFVFREHRPDESWTFVRNPAFPAALGGPPYLSRYVYRVIPEQTTLLTELLTENVDVYIAPAPEQTSRIVGADHLELLDFPFRQYVFVAWNTRRPQLADPRVRRAIAVATDRHRIVEALQSGYGRVANTGVPPFHWAYHEALEDSLAFDREEARRLLDEAGWVDRTGDGVRENEEGVPLEVAVAYNQGNQLRRDIAQIMQSQLREVGISVRPRVMEWAALVQRITDPEVREFEGVILGWVPEFKIDDHDLFHSTKRDGPYQWAGIADPELDRLLDTLQVVVDRSEAIPLWREYQYRILELQPFTYLYFPRRLAGVSRRLRGVEMDVRGDWVNIHRWWIPAEERGRRGG